MTEAEARTAVETTLAVMSKIAERTRTAADDLLIQILHANAAQLTAAVHALSNDANQPPTPDRISAALSAAGIRV